METIPLSPEQGNSCTDNDGDPLLTDEVDEETVE